MGHSKLSVTIPDEIYDQINQYASKEKIKLSHLVHLVTEALIDKLRMIKEQAYIQQVNVVFKDEEVAEEQRRMAASLDGISLTAGSLSCPSIRTGELRLKNLLLDSGSMTMSTVSAARLIDPKPRARTPGVSRYMTLMVPININRY